MSVIEPISRLSGAVALAPRRALCALAFALSTGLAACSSSPVVTEGGQTGGEEPPGTSCTDSPSTTAELDRSATSRAGFSANEVLGALAATPSTPLTFTSDGAQTTLTVGLDYNGPTEYWSSCGELRVGVQLKFATADLVFDEHLPATLIATTANSGSVTLEKIPSGMLHGSLDGTGLGGYDSAALDFLLGFSGGAVHGGVVGLGYESGQLTKTFSVATF